MADFSDVKAKIAGITLVFSQAEIDRESGIERCYELFKAVSDLEREVEEDMLAEAEAWAAWHEENG